MSIECIHSKSLFNRSSRMESTKMENVIILGAAGRDFHDFMVYWSVEPNTEVKCFTGTQIPGIENRTFPPELCNNDKNNDLYPHGLEIFPESMLEVLIDRFNATTCAMAYSDVRYDHVQSLAARVNAYGCKFIQLPPKLTQLTSTKPVIAVCATRTGTGKSQTTRFIARYLKEKGKRIAIVRHPMPYDQVLLKQRCQCFQSLSDLEKNNCTIEEREEYEMHIKEHNLLYAGVDYAMILREAEKKAEIIIWDGGNNDCSFFRANLQICVADALRVDHGQKYYPGETNLRVADIVIINKVNSLPYPELAQTHAESITKITKEGCQIVFANSVVSPVAVDEAAKRMLQHGMLEGDQERKYKWTPHLKALVVDDGPTLTHGGMSFGAGYVLAEKLGVEVIDIRPHIEGSLRGVFKAYPHLQKVLPAMGYGKQQVEDLENTLKNASVKSKCDCIIVGTPMNLNRVCRLDTPSISAQYELQVLPDSWPVFEVYLKTFVE